MSDLPDWIDDRIDRNLDNTLTQEHVVETMVASERPFFSVRQVQARVKPDVSRATVRNRLDELAEIDVVATETYPESVTLYYVNYAESNWPLSPEGKRAIATESPDRRSVGPFTVSTPVQVRPLALAVFATLLVASGVASAVGVGLFFEVGGLGRTVGLVVAGVGLALSSTSAELFVAGIVLFGAERVGR